MQYFESQTTNWKKIVSEISKSITKHTIIIRIFIKDSVVVFLNDN